MALAAGLQAIGRRQRATPDSTPPESRASRGSPSISPPGRSPARSVRRGCSSGSGWRGRRGNCRKGWATRCGSCRTWGRRFRGLDGRTCNWGALGFPLASFPPGATRAEGSPGPLPWPWTLLYQPFDDEAMALAAGRGHVAAEERRPLVRRAVDAVRAVAIRANGRDPAAPLGTGRSRARCGRRLSCSFSWHSPQVLT